MGFQVVLLSGRVASGKSTLVQQLTRRFPDERIHVLKTKDLIQELAKRRSTDTLRAERRAMQDFGDQLDRETEGKWVRDGLVTLINQHTTLEASPIFIVDAVRILPQVRAIREAYGFSVIHIHLNAPEAELEERYKSRSSGLKELKSYKEVEKNTTESRIGDLEESADVVVNTHACSPEDVLVRAANHLGLFTREYRS